MAVRSRLRSFTALVDRLATQAGFSSVMATGILSIASDEVGPRRLSWVFAGIAFALYGLLLSGLPRRLSSIAVESFAAVAATSVLGTRLALAGHRTAALAFFAFAVALWLGIWVALAAARVLGPPSGTRLLAVVATQSLAILASFYTGRLGSTALALLSLGVALYVVLMARFPAAELRRGGGDIWIAMGALAISTLAAARLHARLGGSALEILTVAVWLSATCWVPALVFAELRWRRLRFEPQRWSTVFPLGMYAAGSTAAGRDLGIHDLDLARAFLWAAVAIWLLTAAGAIRTARDPRLARAG